MHRERSAGHDNLELLQDDEEAGSLLSDRVRPCLSAETLAILAKRPHARDIPPLYRPLAPAPRRADFPIGLGHTEKFTLIPPHQGADRQPAGTAA